VALTGQASGRVRRAVIANAPHPTIFPRLQWLDPAQRASSQYFRTFRDPASDQLAREFGLGGVLLKAFGPRESSMDEAERAILLDDWQDRDAAIGMLNWYRASPIEVPPMDAPFALPEHYRELELPRLEVPTLVIWAMDDIALPPSNLDGLGSLVNDLTIVPVSGCGHFVQWEKPEAVNAALDAFLARTGNG
jgi:pimeloyl-ACP methyl ester carboxylesterase